MSRLIEHPGAAALAILGAAGCVVGWAASLVGPRSFVFFGVLGFLCGFIGSVVANRTERKVEAEEINGLRFALRKVALTTAVVAFASLIGLFTTARLDGVSDFPAFEKRPVYELQDHGHRTPVSRLRYVSVTVFFFTGWHGMALLANVCALHRRLYGTDPI